MTTLENEWHIKALKFMEILISSYAYMYSLLTLYGAVLHKCVGVFICPNQRQGKYYTRVQYLAISSHPGTDIHKPRVYNNCYKLLFTYFTT